MCSRCLERYKREARRLRIRAPALAGPPHLSSSHPTRAAAGTACTFSARPRKSPHRRQRSLRDTNSFSRDPGRGRRNYARSGTGCANGDRAAQAGLLQTDDRGIALIDAKDSPCSTHGSRRDPFVLRSYRAARGESRRSTFSILLWRGVRMRACLHPYAQARDTRTLVYKRDDAWAITGHTRCPRKSVHRCRGTEWCDRWPPAVRRSTRP